MKTWESFPLQFYLLFGMYMATLLVNTVTCNHISLSSDEVERCKLSTDYPESCDPIFLNYCNPLSDTYLLESYFIKHSELVDSDFDRFLDEKFGNNSFGGLLENQIPIIKLSSLQSNLLGEGSHRRLVTSIKLTRPSDANGPTQFDTKFCKAVIIEKLPLGIFADPFEVQHMVQNGVYTDAVVFGDTNLELPSSRSGHSVVEIHLDIDRKLFSRNENELEIAVELPLHARYPPLDGCGYSKVVLGAPHIFLQCRKENVPKQDCSWRLTLHDAGAMDDTALVWQVPCGVKTHSRFVTTVTFLSALVSALSIVLTAILYSSPSNTSKKYS